MKTILRQEVLQGAQACKAVVITWPFQWAGANFSSTVFMESNARGVKVTDYTTGKDALIESDAIKNKIRKVEEDMWEY